MAVPFPSSRSETSPYSYTSVFASTSVANFSPRASPLMMQSSSSSSANVKLHGQRLPPSVRFSVEKRPDSPGRRSMTMTKDTSNNNNAVSSSESSKRSFSWCMCSPTRHPGSFRCAYHKSLAKQEEKRQQQKQQQQQTASSRSRTLDLRRSAMKNSLVRLGMEGELVKRTLITLIRPSPQQLPRREAFQARPSRLSHVSKALD